MITYVVETCVLVKLVVSEDYSDIVSVIAELHRASRFQLIAPDFILTECANVLWKHARRHNAPIADMKLAFEILRRVRLVV